jgi:hypothetical protein
MPKLTLPLVCASLALGLPGTGVQAQSPQGFEGFLCCNMQSDGSWISDINYHAQGKQRVKAGTPVKVTGYGRWRVLVEIDGKSLAIGNDYSRDIKLEDFARRYVVAEDPAAALKGVPAKVREAIAEGKVMRGMTRPQVLMALGYPISSYTPNLDVPLWRYWLDRSSEFQVFWGEDGRVDNIFGTPGVRARVTLE